MQTTLICILVLLTSAAAASIESADVTTSSGTDLTSGSVDISSTTPNPPSSRIITRQTAAADAPLGSAEETPRESTGEEFRQDKNLDKLEPTRYTAQRTTDVDDDFSLDQFRLLLSTLIDSRIADKLGEMSLLLLENRLNRLSDSVEAELDKMSRRLEAGLAQLSERLQTELSQQSFRTDSLGRQLTGLEAAVVEQASQEESRLNQLSERLEAGQGQQTAVEDRLDQLSEALNHLSERLEAGQGQQAAVEVRLDQLSERLEAGMGQQSAVEVTLDQLSSRLDQHSTQLQSLARDSSQLETAVGQQVTNLETRLDQLPATLSSSEVREISQEVTRNFVEQFQFESPELESLEERVNTLASNLTHLECFHNKPSEVVLGHSSGMVVRLPPGQYGLTLAGGPQYEDGEHLTTSVATSCGATQIRLTCPTFSLESHSSCGYDYFQVGDRKFCGSSGPGLTLNALDTPVQMIFHSDGSNTGSMVCRIVAS